MSTNTNQLPQDKTPAQRAQIKLIEQFALVFVINAALAGYVLWTSYAARSKPDWTIVIIVAVAQGLIALFNALEKYFSAKNEPLFSALFEAARQEVQTKAPPVQYSAADQALQQSLNAAFYPTYPVPAQTATPIVAPQNASVPSSLKPVTLQPMPAESTPVVVPTPNLPPAGAVTTNTVPGMPVVAPGA